MSDRLKPGLPDAQLRVRKRVLGFLQPSKTRYLPLDSPGSRASYDQFQIPNWLITRDTRTVRIGNEPGEVEVVRETQVGRREPSRNTEIFTFDHVGQKKRVRTGRVTRLDIEVVKK